MKAFIATCILITALFAPITVGAQNECPPNYEFDESLQDCRLVYQPLAPIAGLENDLANNRTEDSFSDYLNGMFRLGLGIATALAIIMIVIGGVRYMSTDSVTGKKDGLGYVNAAVGGLLLVIFSWLILRTLNPALLSTSLNVDNPNEPEPVLIPVDERRPLTNAERLSKALDEALQDEDDRDKARKQTLEEFISDLELDGIESVLLERMLGSRDAAIGRLANFLLEAEDVSRNYFNQRIRTVFEQETARNRIAELKDLMLKQYLSEKGEIETHMSHTGNQDLIEVGNQILQQLLDHRQHIFREMSILNDQLL